METAFFWIAWGLISFWALKTFYFRAPRLRGKKSSPLPFSGNPAASDAAWRTSFSYDKEKLRKLRKTAFGINLAVLILFFLPWLPLSRGGLTGWEIFLQGEPLVVLLFVLIAVSTFSFLTKDHGFLKTGAVLNIAASVLFIATMMRLAPGTFKLTLYSVAPIIASLLLLANNVVVLLLWQQLQLKTKK